MSVKPRVHPVDEVLPVPKLALYGFQHVVAFYAGAVLVPIIIAGAINLPQEDLVKLITADLFTCGIASIIQAVGFWKIGVRLPLLQGVTFAGVSPIIAIGLAHGGGAASLLYVYGAVIVAGVFTFLIAPIFIKLLRFFPPVVTGTLITIIGLCLVPVGAVDAVTNPHTHEHDPTNIRWFLYALGTIAIIVAIQRLFRGFLATIAVLLGLVIGCVVAFALGDMNFDKVGEAARDRFHPAVPVRHAQVRRRRLPDDDHRAADHRGGVDGVDHRDRRDRRQAHQGLRHRQRAARRRPGHRHRRRLQLVPVHGVLGERRPGATHRRQEPLGGGRRRRHHDHPRASCPRSPPSCRRSPTRCSAARR